MVGRYGRRPSFLLVDLGALLTQLPVPAGREVPHVTPALKLLSLIQPTVLLSVAVLIGVVLAPKVGLSSPTAEAVEQADSFSPASTNYSRLNRWFGGFRRNHSRLVFMEAVPAASVCGGKRESKVCVTAADSSVSANP